MSTRSRPEIEDRIKRLLASELAIPPHVLAGCRSDTPLLGRGVGLDSIEGLALAVAIETEFDIRIEDDELTVHLFKDLTTLAEHVMQKTSLSHAG
jgi:acyl carrier protein